MEKHHLFLFLIWLLCIFHQATSAAFLRHNRQHSQEKRLPARHRRQWGDFVGYDTDDYDYGTQSWDQTMWGSFIQNDYSSQDANADFLGPMEFAGGFFNDNPVPTHDMEVSFPSTRDDPGQFQPIQEVRKSFINLVRWWSTVYCGKWIRYKSFNKSN